MDELSEFNDEFIKFDTKNFNIFLKHGEYSETTLEEKQNSLKSSWNSQEIVDSTLKLVNLGISFKFSSYLYVSSSEEDFFVNQYVKNFGDHFTD